MASAGGWGWGWAVKPCCIPIGGPIGPIGPMGRIMGMIGGAPPMNRPGGTRGPGGTIGSIPGWPIIIGGGNVAPRMMAFICARWVRRDARNQIDWTVERFRQ